MKIADAVDEYHKAIQLRSDAWDELSNRISEALPEPILEPFTHTQLLTIKKIIQASVEYSLKINIVNNNSPAAIGKEISDESVKLIEHYLNFSPD